jgi:hypothetical protein
MRFHQFSLSFLDRDMFMRFRGGGVGHKSTSQATQFAYDDRDMMDANDYESNDSDDAETASEHEPTDDDQDNHSPHSDESDSDLDSEGNANCDSDLDVEPLDEYGLEGFAEF